MNNWCSQKLGRTSSPGYRGVSRGSLPRLGCLCNSSHVPSWVGNHLPAGFGAALLHPDRKCGWLGSSKRRFPEEEALTSPLPEGRAEGAALMQCWENKNPPGNTTSAGRGGRKSPDNPGLEAAPARTKETPRDTALPNCPEFHTPLPHSWPPQGWGHQDGDMGPVWERPWCLQTLIPAHCWKQPLSAGLAVNAARCQDNPLISLVPLLLHPA